MLMTNLRSPGEAAALMKANLDLDLKSGQLILIIQDWGVISIDFSFRKDKDKKIKSVSSPKLGRPRPPNVTHTYRVKCPYDNVTLVYLNVKFIFFLLLADFCFRKFRI